MSRQSFTGPAGAFLLAVCLGASAAPAQDRLQPDFTFRRVRPPAPDHSGPRITVQITPQTAPAAEEAPQDTPASAAQGPGAGWFWGAVPTAIDAPGPERLQAALTLMQTAPDARAVPAPRLQHLQGLARDHAARLLMSSVGTRVSPALALAVMSVESGGVTHAESGAGAQGLMQLMPDTAARFDVTDPLDPAQNIRGGIAYLDWLIGHFDGDMLLALAAYNAGEGAVRDHGGIPPYPETRAYIPKVLAAWTVARGLCQTPPVLMSDGCVFVTG